ncbi:chloride channel protein, partial [Trypanosoma cruzi]
AAAGGGIPDVIAYLNGVHVPHAMNFRTFVAKSISCMCAVAGGLPVGLEAPLIHLGAITGAGVTQGRSRTLGFQTKLFQAFRNNKDRRDFITAGAACGVSAAFGAPIGGLLFVMEEVSSFWDHSASGQIFLATMICFTTISMIRSVLEDQRLLGWVSNAVSVLFEVNLTIPLNLLSIVPSFFLGIFCGAFAAVFTKVNLMLLKYRRRRLRPFVLCRFLEPLIIVLLYGTLSYMLALVPDCRPMYEMNSKNGTFFWGTENRTRLFTATCAKADEYAPLATLTMGNGKDIIRHL